MPGVAGIAGEIADRAASLPSPARRNLIAIAGPPGAGKSTVSAAILTALSDRGIEAGLVAMDGFHLDNAVLQARGLLSRKGAAETFDLAGLTVFLDRLLAEPELVGPGFDRALDKSIAGCTPIGAGMTTVIVEGNYLLLDEPGWRDLRRFWSLSVFLSVPAEVLAGRLTRRWRDHGLTALAARERAETNDLPNARRVCANRLQADVVIDCA